MGCTNSVALPQPISDIRRTISKIAPEKEVNTHKKIAKNFNNFEDFLHQLKLLLKQNEFYDFLFRAEYFQEMLDFISSTYTNHQQAMKIIALALEYMALTKNFINGRQTLKTKFTLQALPSQLSKRWTEIRKQVTFANQNCLRALNYLAYDVQKEKCWFDHSFLELKFDFSMEETKKVADAAKDVCKLDRRGFLYFSNYLLKCCVKEYEETQDMTKVEEKLNSIIEQVLAGNPFPLSLNGEEVLFNFHKNYKPNSLQIPKIQLDLSQVKPNLKVQTIENFIFDKAKLAIKSLTKFNRTFQEVCYDHGCSHYKSQVRLKTRSQKNEILKIKEEFVGFAAEKKDFQKIWKQVANPSFQNLTGLEYQVHRKEVNNFCQNQTGKLKFKVSDMLRSQCTFNDINQLNDCCDALLKQIIKKGYKLIELSNKLRVEREIPHILLKVLVEEIVCEFKIFFQYNFSGFHFSSLLHEMSKYKHYSLVAQLKNFNDEITTDFVKEASEIIQSNQKNKYNFGEKLTFSDIRPFFKEFVSVIPSKVDLSKKHQQSIDFNLIFDELQEYKLIQEEFINEQVKVEKNQKIRRIAEYLFYQKKFQLSSMLFTLYQKEIEENHAYLFDKIAKGSKQYIKAQIQLIKSYSESMHFLAEISREKQSYDEEIEYLKKYTHFNTLKEETKEEKVKVLKRMAEAFKIEKNYDEAIKIYHQCFQGKDDELSNAEIHHLLSELQLKVKNYEEALKQEMSNYQILDKKKRNSLECVNSLKRLAEIYKASNKTPEAFDKIAKAKQIAEIVKSKYSLEYVDLLVQLGNFQQKMNKYNNAVINFQEAMEILEKLQGDHYMQVQKLHLKLGHLYQQLDNNIQAIKRYKKNQQIVKYIFGSKSHEHSNILSNLGLAYQNIAQYQLSINCFLQCLQIRKELLGEKNMEYIRTVINIGVVYDEQGMSGQALTKYKESLALLEKHYGIQNSDYAKVLNNIGSVQQQQGNYQEALKHFKQALVIKEKQKGVASKEYATTLSNIGMVHDDMCDYTSALKEYLKCVEIFEQMKSKNDSLLAATYNNIGTTYMHLSNYKEALKYYGKCLMIEQHLRGVESREYSLCLHSIGIVKLEQGDYAEAEQLFEKAKRILKKNISSNSFEYSQILVSFGKLYLNTRLIDQALVCFQQAQQILQRSKGSSHVSEIDILLQKGIANIRLQQPERALQLLQKGLRLCEENNYKYREYANLHYNIGIVYMNLEQYMKSKKYLMKAMMMQQRFFDFSWKLTSVKLAAIMHLTLQEKLFEVYSTYSRPDQEPPKRPGNKQNNH